MKTTVIVDLDNTLSLVGDRVEHILKPKGEKDWDSFFARIEEDELNFPVAEVIRSLFPTYKIVFCTARDESLRDKTTRWLAKNGFFVSPSSLLMRKEGDKRDDSEIKPELLEEAGINLSEILFVLEDRDRIVKMWRSLGVTCFQVQEGNF